MTALFRTFLLIFVLGAFVAPAGAQVSDGLTSDSAEDVAEESAEQQVNPADGLTVEDLTAQADALTPVFDDLDEWNSLADRVEAAIAAGRASTATLDELRADVSVWRDTFLSRQSTNSGRIATVTAQINALGEPSEDEDIRVTARRAALQETLDTLRAPATLASEAYARANGLIAEIDGIIRDRQADKLTERVQSPLNPAGWASLIDNIDTSFRAIRAEITTALSSAQTTQSAVAALPTVVLLFAGALVLLLRGRRWTGWLDSQVTARTRRGQGVWQFVISLGKVILPFLGLLLFSSALDATGLIGRRLTPVVDALPYFGLMPIVAHWIGRLLLFPRVEGGEVALALPEGSRERSFRLIVILGYVHALALAAISFMDANGFDVAPRSLVVFVIGVLMALVLFRIGRELRKLQDSDADSEIESESERGFRFGVRRLLGRVLMGIALVGVTAGALGYIAVFELMIFPAAQTLYLFGLLIVLQRLSVDIYTLLVGLESGGQDALIPVLIGFALVVLSLPVLALIWGARQTDLLEYWSRFQDGFALGGGRISPSDFLKFALVFVIGYTLTRLLQGALRSSILPRTKLDTGGKDAIVAGTGYIGIFLAALVAITTAGIDLSGLAIVAGALSVGIGFGLQTIVSNFVSGIILLIERPISQGDWIEVGGQMGYVREISVRSTRIETFDRTDVIIPNADLVSGPVINWTRGNNVGRVIVPVGVAYGTDTGRVAQILREIAEAHPMVLMNPPPSVIFQGFGADSLDFEIRAILRDVNWVLSVKSELNHAIAKRFTEEEIEIPFAQRDIWLRNPETLAGQASQKRQDSARANSSTSGGKPQTPDNDGVDSE